MKAKVLTGTKEQIAEQLAALTGDVREAIVFVEEPIAAIDPGGDIFAEMDAFMLERRDAEGDVVADNVRERDTYYHRDAE